MTKQDPEPRLPKLSAAARSAEASAIFALFAGPGKINVDENHVLNTFAQHPPLANKFLAFNQYLLSASTLPVRWRQIAIMRVSWCKKSRYVWSSHLRTSLRNGVEAEAFDPIKAGAAADYWNAQEVTVLRATDYLLAHDDLNDELWHELNSFLDTQQVMDFIFTVGAYQLLAMTCRTLRIDREQALLELAAQYGAPDER